MKPAPVSTSVRLARNGAVVLGVLLLVLLGPGTAAAGTSPGGGCRAGDRGRLVRYEKVAAHPTVADAQAYFDAWYGFYRDFYQLPTDPGVQIAYGFDSYKVTYCTVDVPSPGRRRPVPTTATGNISVPHRAGPLPTVTYLHGTAVSSYDAPSNPTIASEANPYGESFEGPASSAVFAGAGFVYVAPDYLGLGGSTVARHRYFNAATEAAAGVDLLAASHPVLARLHVRENGQRFLFGFSEGGHAALAVQRELERRRIGVTTTATVGGVFDVEAAFLDAVQNPTAITVPLYVAYLLQSYDDVYDVYDDPAVVFREPYAGTVPGLLDMHHSFDEVIGGLPATPQELLTPAYVDRVLSDPGDPMRVRLRQNAVDRWRPRAPIRVYQSPDDQDSKIAIARASVDRLRDRGGDVRLRPVSGDHVQSWVQALPRAVAYFREAG